MKRGKGGGGKRRERRDQKKKIRLKFAIFKKFATRTPVSTKQTNRVAPKKHTSGIDKKFFLSNLISRGLRKKHTEKSDKNSEKKFSVLAGLIPCTLSIFENNKLISPGKADENLSSICS